MPTDPFGRPQRRQPPDEIDLARFVKPTIAALVALFVLLAAVQCVYTVEPSERAVVLRFGEFQQIAEPGLHFRVPFADKVETVSVEVHSLRLPQETLGADRQGAPGEEALMLTGELYAANVEWTVQWQVLDPEKYLFAFDRAGDAEAFSRIIATASRSVMNRLVGDYSIDEVLTSKRGEIAAEARQATQAMLDQYDCGVTIKALQLQRVTAPAEVKQAFDDVVAADQDQERLESEAEKSRAQLLNESEAERDRLIQEAQGYADRQQAEVDGEIAALRLKYEAYRAAPDVTRQRLYLEAMQEVLAGVSGKTILDADLERLLPLLPINPEANR
ncbi:FtsH protease activity modulator HflK [Alienimonas californiensis]|uniref:Protein HflK n=1 Tax=Alienimonas californiensis TaxID=2527989 RepID=A0A517PD80_9PLAN|nr:FtsH protease activity modulator HflK [Alienimonas californiensis]QDT17333.1 Modulator of FtsH protease HflK [Alienimonas californiensis]